MCTSSNKYNINGRNLKVESDKISIIDYEEVIIMNNLVRYRFKTKAVDDYRPLLDMKGIQMPWWCTGVARDDSYAIIVCYLPKGEDLLKYWDDAYDIDSEERTEITYTDRFPKPNWL